MRGKEKKTYDICRARPHDRGERDDEPRAYRQRYVRGFLPDASLSNVRCGGGFFFFAVMPVHALQRLLLEFLRRVPEQGPPLRLTRGEVLLLGTRTIPGEDIERQLQGLDRGELGRRDRQRIRAWVEAAEDLEGEEENGIGHLRA